MWISAPFQELDQMDASLLRMSPTPRLVRRRPKRLPLLPSPGEEMCGIFVALQKLLMSLFVYSQLDTGAWCRRRYSYGARAC